MTWPDVAAIAVGLGVPLVALWIALRLPDGREVLPPEQPTWKRSKTTRRTKR